METDRRKKLLKYILPSLASQCAILLFSIVDGVFVGRGVGTDALGAVNIAFPYIMIFCAVFMLTTVGGVTVTAIRLGRGDVQGANNAFMHSLTATAIFAVVFMLIGCLFTSSLAKLLGAGETYHDMVCDYIFYYCIFIIPEALNMALLGFGRNDDAPVLVMISNIIGTSLNILLDWIFVFPLRKGLAGAATASGISQSVSFIIILCYFLSKKGRLRICRFTFSSTLMRKVFKRGVPEMFSQFAAPIATICMNNMLGRYLGDAGVNAFSIIGYIVTFAFAVFFGISEGIQPLFGQSYGEKNEGNLLYYKRAGIILSIIGSVVVYVTVNLTSRFICRIFGAEATAAALAVKSLPVFGITFVFTALNTIISAYLYSTKRTAHSVTINVTRGFLLIPLFIVVLSIISNGALIWAAMGICEAVGLMIAVTLMNSSEKSGINFNRK